MNSVVQVIEDDTEMANFMKNVLVDEGFQVYVDTTGLGGLSSVEKVGPEIVLLDLNLPDVDGRTVCQKIKAYDSQIQVIMITAESTPQDVALGLNIGADDYIAKPLAPEVLLARIKARLRSRGRQSQKLQVGTLSLDLTTHQVKRGENVIVLSAQEFKLLEYFLSNPDKVLSREMILSRIWQSSPDIETRVVDVYVGYLRKKIDTEPKKMIKSVRGFGYMLQTPKI